MPQVIRRQDIAKETDRRFTLPSTIALIKDFAGVDAFDLAPTSEALSHHAPKWYGPIVGYPPGSAHLLGPAPYDGWLGPDGLEPPWFGRVFSNPPWSQSALWVEKAQREFRLGNCSVIAMLLPVRTDQGWWHGYVEPFRDRPDSDLRVKFFRGRTRYGTPEDPTGAKAGSPWFGSCVLVWRKP